MKTASLLGLPTFVLTLVVSGCGAETSSQAVKDGADRVPSNTSETLRALKGQHFGVNEYDYGSTEKRAEAASVVVRGPVTDITDFGPLGEESNSATHEFRLKVRVVESIKGEAGDNVFVRTSGIGDADDMRKTLSADDGLWMLAKGYGTDDLVLVESEGVLFEQEDGKVVAPLAEMEHEPEEQSLEEATENAREGAESADQSLTPSPGPDPE